MDVPPSTKTILRYKTYNDTHTINYSLSNCFIQVYLVAGGTDGIDYLSSTEIYEGGKWTEVGALPAAVSGVRGASLQNTVYMMGKGSVMTGVLLIICSQVAMIADHIGVMISGSMMPTQSSGRGLTKCQRQEIGMPCPLWQTRILQDIVIIN